MSTAHPLREHPADVLIRTLVATRRPATLEERVAIIARLASAPFDERVARISPDLSRIIFQGKASETFATSLAAHLAKQTVLEDQWSMDTTASQYIADLRRAVLAPTARLAIYARRGGNLAATFTPTAEAVPPSRLSAGRQPNLLVVYSADRGMVITGYQCTGLATTSVPETALWLN